MGEAPKNIERGYTVTINAVNTITKKQNVFALLAGRFIGLVLSGMSSWGVWTLLQQDTPSVTKLVVLTGLLLVGLALVIPEIMFPLLMGLVGLYKKVKS